MPFKFFPFSPGIPWEVRQGVVLKKIPLNYLYTILDKKDIIISCHGGLIESYCSLLYLEAVRKNISNCNLLWNGSKDYHGLIEANGLANVFNGLKPKALDNYPTPIVFDKKGSVIFNCLFNYRKEYNIQGKLVKVRKDSLVKQIFAGCFYPWSKKYIPEFRNLKFLDRLNDWMKAYKFNFDSKFVVIIPDRTGYSKYPNVCLSWNANQIKSLASLLKPKNITTIVFSDNVSKYLDKNILVLPCKLEYMIYFISKSKAVLSREVDFLLIALINSSALVASVIQKNEFRLNFAHNFTKTNAKYYTRRTISPIDVYNQILLDS